MRPLFRRIFRRPVASIDCRGWTRLVTDYIEGALPLEVAARVDAHLGECTGCTRYLDQMRTTIAVVGHLSHDDVNSAMPNELRRALLAVFHEPAR